MCVCVTKVCVAQRMTINASYQQRNHRKRDGDTNSTHEQLKHSHTLHEEQQQTQLTQTYSKRKKNIGKFIARSVVRRVCQFPSKTISHSMLLLVVFRYCFSSELKPTSS